MAEAIPALSQEERSRFLTTSSVALAAFLAKAQVISHASSSKSVVRAPEGIEFDLAAVTDITNPENIPDDLTDRYYALERQYSGKTLKNTVYVAVKSFAFQKVHFASTSSTRSYCQAMVNLSDTQAKRCQAIIVVSLLDPEWVAVIPRPYLHLIRKHKIVAVLGAEVTPTMARMCPLPAELCPFIMPISLLGQAMDNIAARAADTNVEIRNPFTNYNYQRCTSWKPKKARFDDLMSSANTAEYKLSRSILEAFKAQGQSSNFTARLPDFTPVTSDLKLKHTSGITVFIEFEVGVVSIKDGPNGTVILEHSATTQGQSKSSIFTFLAPWDYLFSLPSASSSYALMIKKDHWPSLFWHRLPAAQGEWLSHTFPDATFTDAHKVRLDASQETLVNDICSIILLRGVPQKAALSAAKILEFAGPCPPSMLWQQRVLQAASDFEDDASDSDVIETNEESVKPGTANDDQPAAPGNAEAEDSAGGDVEESPGGDSRTKQDGRIDTTTQCEMFRLTRLFVHLMDESRYHGSGCPIFLGAYHPDGNIGFIHYQWSEADKRAFDKNGKVPCWIGNLSNETPMITLVSQYSQWRSGYGPIEGTEGEIAALRNAESCLVVCNSVHGAYSHHQQYVWLVPSEYMSKVSIGAVKSKMSAEEDLKDQYFESPFFLKDKTTVDDFIVDNIQLHATILKFLSGNENITIGHGDIRIQPYQYLKTVRRIRLGTDVDMDFCRNTMQYSA